MVSYYIFPREGLEQCVHDVCIEANAFTVARTMQYCADILLAVAGGIVSVVAPSGTYSIPSRRKSMLSQSSKLFAEFLCIVVCLVGSADGD